MKIKILLADDHKILRDGLRSLLEKEPDIDVIGEAENGKTAVQLACDLQPDIVIMDIGMPDLNGMEATKEILQKAPNIRVLALSTYSDKRFVIGMLKVGALGYLVKDCAFEEIVTAIHALAANKKYIAPKQLESIVNDYLNNLSGKTQLTPRESEVLCLIALGKNSKEIASELQISIKTVDTHRQNIMRKLELYTVADLTRYAIRIGLISIDY